MSANPKGYSGWTNWETWNWKLWIDNEEGSSREWQDRARECWENAEDEDDRKAAAAYELAALLDTDARDNSPLPASGPYTDIMGAALDEINFEEIAESMIGDIEDES